MGLLGKIKGIFNRSKSEAENVYHPDWDEESLKRDNIDMHDRKQRENYVKACLEQMAEASKELDTLGGEYNLVTSYLTDMEEIEAQPEEIKELEADWCVANQLIQEYKAIGKVEHALDLLKAEQEGRLVVLPCKIGDTLYMIVKKPIPEKGWLRYVRRFSLTYKKLAWVRRCLGKRVFPSLEEAEAAIADMERKAGAE